MANIFNIKDDIVKVLFYLNLILFVIGIFISSKGYFLSVIMINIILDGSFIIICKYSSIFESRGGAFGNLFGKIGNTIDYLNNSGNKDGKIQR